MPKTVALAVLASLTVGVAQTPVFAAGESSSTTVPNCRKNFVWDKRKKKCVKAKKSSGLTDRNLYEAAKGLAYSRRYGEALAVLDLAADQNAPRILTYRGFTTRKLGDVEAGMGFYRAALAIDPDYTLAREYMGEAFLQLGQVDEAKAQLAEIATRCGTGCREYAMLDERIAAYVN